jgi:hypothetical protein
MADFNLDTLEVVTSIKCGNLLLPTVDGTVGQLIKTDGAGNLSVSTSKYVTGPVSSVDTQIPIYNGITGDAIATSSATLTALGVGTFSGLVNGALTLPTVDGTSGQVVTTDGAGVLTLQSIPPGSGQSSAFAEVITLYNTNLTPGDHIKFNTIGYSLGGAITVDTTTTYTNTANVASLGRATLAGGKSYMLKGTVPYLTLTGHTGSITLQWFNANTTTAIGNAFKFDGDGAASPVFAIPMIKAYFAPPASPATVRVELRITAANNLSSITRAYLEIEQVPF